MQFMHVQDMRVAKLKRFMDRENFPLELELHRVDCLGSHGHLDNHTFLREKAEEFACEPLVPAPLITGNDLIERGIKPGPRLGEILAEVQDLQLEGKLTDREEALAWIEKEKEV